MAVSVSVFAIVSTSFGVAFTVIDAATIAVVTFLILSAEPFVWLLIVLNAFPIACSVCFVAVGNVSFKTAVVTLAAIC